MKVSLPISIVALILSIASLIYSNRAHSPVDQDQVQQAAREALKEREKIFVENTKPKVQAMFAEMDDEFGKEWNPETIEELMEPITKVINAMAEQ